MSFILTARNEEELQVNAWNWRPTLLLLLNENLIDLEHHNMLGTHGCRARVDADLAGRFADAIERRLKLADMKPGQRMLADLTVTSDERKLVTLDATTNTDDIDGNDLYSAKFEWLVTFGDFCRRSGGFEVF
jgi:hypothetical protein